MISLRRCGIQVCCTKLFSFVSQFPRSVGLVNKFTQTTIAQISYQTSFLRLTWPICLGKLGIIVCRSKRRHTAKGARRLKGSTTNGHITIFSSRSQFTISLPLPVSAGSLWHHDGPLFFYVYLIGDGTTIFVVVYPW